MTLSDARPSAAPRSRRLDVGLWVAQGALALSFIGGGIFKIVTPVDDLADIFPWTGEVSPFLLYSTSGFDILGGLGVLLPSLTRVQPRTAVLAALGCVALQGSAIAFHLSRGEASDVPMNFAFAAVAAFIAWGRWSKAPIEPRA